MTEMTLIQNTIQVLRIRSLFKNLMDVRQNLLVKIIIFKDSQKSNSNCDHYLW